VTKTNGFSRLDHLDGLRGLAALLVVLTHYAQAFAPGILTSVTDFDRGYEKIISGTPLNLLFHGRFWVAVFFVLSGYVISLPGVRDPSTRLAISSVIKRYPRLAIPALASAIFAWTVAAVTHGRYFTEVAPITFTQMKDRYSEAGSFFDAVMQGGFGAFFLNQSSINPVLWTIGIELFGSILVIGIVWAIPEYKRRMLVCTAIVVLMAGQNWWPAFAMGVIAADITTRFELSERFRRVVVFLLVISAIWLGSYPDFGSDKGIWQYLPVGPGRSLDFYSSTGAFFLVMAVCFSKSAKSIFSSRIFVYLGGISYSLYLVHFPLMLCCASYFVLRALRMFSYWDAIFIAFIPSMALMFICAEVFKRLVDIPSIRISCLIGRKISEALNRTASKETTA